MSVLLLVLVSIDLLVEPTRQIIPRRALRACLCETSGVWRHTMPCLSVTSRKHGAVEQEGEDGLIFTTITIDKFYLTTLCSACPFFSHTCTCRRRTNLPIDFSRKGQSAFVGAQVSCLQA